MISSVSNSFSSVVPGAAGKESIAAPVEPSAQAVLDPIDISSFSVTSTDTDAGKADPAEKSKMGLKDYIAYMLLLLEKLNSLKEEGPQPLNARLENKDEMAKVLSQLDTISAVK